MSERRYHVFAVYDTLKVEVCLSRPEEPLTHQEAVTFRSNMLDLSYRRLELRETIEISLED